MEYVKEKWSTEVFSLVIGATKDNGGTRNKVLKIGGQKTLAFLKFEGETPNKPIVLAEVLDFLPEDLWPTFYKKFENIVKEPLLWIKEIESSNPDGICIRLLSCHPDMKNNSKEYLKKFIPEVLKTTKLPLIILGSGHIEKDAEILPFVAELTKGEKILLGMAVKENYKTIISSLINFDHSIIVETPLDINLAKQLNILVTDLGFPLDRIVMHHTTGGLGYGFEYCYSIIERCRLAALQGDKVMSTPIINLISEETWKTKEAKSAEDLSWGEDEIKRAIIWEITTALGYLHAGTDILVLAHPESIRKVKSIIDQIE